MEEALGEGVHTLLYVDLLLALCSDIIPGVQATTRNAEDPTRVDFMQGRCLNRTLFFCFLKSLTYSEEGIC